jgi:predicted Zn-dependent protease
MRRFLPALLHTLLLLPALLAALAWPGVATAQRFVQIRDAETESMLRAVASPLFRAAGLDRSLVRIIVLQDRAINAFVSSNNRMFVHTGLIVEIAGVDELAGVLAHETGHISGTHIARLPAEMEAAMRSMIVAMVLGGAAAAAGGSQAGIGVAAAGQALAMRSFFAFTRAQENAADQAALVFLERAGWTPAGLGRLFARLADQELLPADAQDPYMRTHPLTRERIDVVNQGVQRSRFGNTPMPAALEHRFRMTQAKLIGFIEAPINAQRRLEGRKDAAAEYGRAIIAWRSGRLAEGIAMLEKLSAAERGNPFFHEMKGQMLFESGRVRDSLTPYREAARLAPGEPLIRVALARALLEANDPVLLRQALREAEASLALERDSAFTWRQLGLIWTRLGDEAQASLALAEEAFLRGDLRQARMAAARAEALLPPGPSRLRAQDLAAATRVEREERNRR